MTNEEGASPEIEEEPASTETPRGDAASGDGAPPESPEAPEKTTDWEKRYKDTHSEYQRLKTQEATWRQERETIQEYLRSQSANTQRQQQVDPIAEAEREFAEAGKAFDADAQVAALRKMRALERQAMNAEAAQTASRTFDLKRGMDEAAAFGVTDANEMAKVYQSMTPKEVAIIKRWRDGTLPEALDSERKAAKARADQAAAFAGDTARGVGGGRRVPGSLETPEPETREVPAAVYYAFSENYRKKRWPNAIVV